MTAGGSAASSTPAAGDDLRLAVVAIVLTVLALSLGDAIIKLISADFLLWQIFVLRSVLAMPALAAIGLVARREGLQALTIRAPVWTGLRSLLLAGMWVAYYASLPHLKLSIAASAYYTLPIFITLLSAVFLKERVGLVGWFAVALGFVGVLLILEPRADDFNSWVLLPLVSAVCYALAMILTRTRCRGEHPLALSLGLNLAFLAVGLAGTAAGMVHAAESGSAGAYLLGEWAPMGARQWGAMVFLAAVVVFASIGNAIAYQRGKPSVIASFDFAYVGFAVIWGAVFFQELPEARGAVGIVLIVCAGILAVRRRA